MIKSCGRYWGGIPPSPARKRTRLRFFGGVYPADSGGRAGITPFGYLSCTSYPALCTERAVRGEGTQCPKEVFPKDSGQA